jgi:L-iditol 2-dehydrogenase
MLEPVNTVLKAVKRLNLLRGDVVLVAGQGPIGLMFTRLLQLAGARVVATDLFPARLKLAKKFGARWTLSGNDSQLSRKIARIAGQRGLDAAVIAVPSDDVVRQAQAMLRGGGQLMVFAHTRRGVETGIDLATVCVDEKDLLGSYSSDVTLQAEVARLVFSRRLDVRPLITHQLGLEQTAEAIRLASSPGPNSLKIVVGGDI